MSSHKDCLMSHANIILSLRKLSLSNKAKSGATIYGQYITSAVNNQVLQTRRRPHQGSTRAKLRVNSHLQSALYL